MDRRERFTDEQELMLQTATDAQQARMWTALPAMVVSVDFSNQTITAQPTIQGVVSGQNVAIPLLVDVPLCFPRGGGFAITLPVKAGDEVLVVFASRCIDGWWSMGGVQPQLDTRMHDLSDGFAILAPTSVPKALTSVSPTDLQIRTDSGSTRIAIAPTGAVTITAPAGITMAGNVTVAGNLAVTTGGALSVNGLDFATHRHGGVQTGTGTTGTPQA